MKHLQLDKSIIAILNTSTNSASTLEIHFEIVANSSEPYPVKDLILRRLNRLWRQGALCKMAHIRPGEGRMWRSRRK